MGCDIHFYAEKFDNGVWETADRWEPAEDADQPGVPKQQIDYKTRFYSGRNYDLFAILADVRNGRGFAGVDTGDGFVPIDDPRGLPEDVSELVRIDADHWDGDGHSHSWFTLAELLAYDWTQTTKHRGWVDALTFWDWNRYDRKNGEAPKSYSGGVSGGGVKHISIAEMVTIAISADEVRKTQGWDAAESWIKSEHPSTYTQAQWEQPYYKTVRNFWSDTIPQLLRLGKPDDVRIVFWFDN